MKKIIFILLLSVLTVSCTKKTARKHTNTTSPTSSLTNAGRYAIQQDRAPTNTDFNLSSLQAWDIQTEPLSKYGNHSPYIVFGKTYYLADTAKNFEQTGMASWYGKKFHGHKTSNMETFDMYKLTAAHRTLPLPSYVEVTNLANNKKVVVRVNDRGPFKSKRIIDLSWAAAKALDYDKKGLAKVHIRLLHPQTQKPTQQVQNIPTPNQDLPQYKTDNNLQGLKYLQIGAYSQKAKALDIAKGISKSVLMPVHVSNTASKNPLFRVRIGPLLESDNIIDIIQKVHTKGFVNTKMVVE